MTPPISRFPVPARGDLPDDLRARFDAVEERSGFLPNVFAALSWRPAEATAFFAMHDALMDKETPGLSKADRELIVVATSAEHDCLYCVVAHGAIARIRARDPNLAAQVAVDRRQAPLSPRVHAVPSVAAHRAIARTRALIPSLANQVAVDRHKAPLPPRMHAVLDVAVRLAVDPAAVTAGDLDALRGHGLTEDDVWDVGAIVSFFALSNRLAHWAAIPPNEEFFLMGRVPRS